MLLSCFALLSLFGCNAAQLSGAGALGILAMATITAYGWGETEKVRIVHIYNMAFRNSVQPMGK